MINFSSKDKEILRKLATKKAEIAALDIQAVRRNLWTRMNKLEAVKPMLFMSDYCWAEIKVDNECQCEDKFARDIELKLRRELWQWDNTNLDFVIENWIDCPLAINNSRFGISEVSEERHTQEGNIYSHGYINQINEPEDVAKIKDPVVTLDEELTEARFTALNDAVGDIIPVKKAGERGFWLAAWDTLICWWGAQNAMMDLAMRPEMVHSVFGRLIDAYSSMLDQLIEINGLSMNNLNYRVGSGAYGYTDELPAEGSEPDHVKPCDLWGFATAQIFSEVSPEMHDEFAIKYETKILKRFGLNYYGCCEPLHNKIDKLEQIPNLRKISISPWAHLESAVEQMRGKYVISYKPNPAIFAETDWDLGKARADLEQALETMKGCAVEIIPKDLSTTRNEPERLTEWSEMASEVTRNFG